MSKKRNKKKTKNNLMNLKWHINEWVVGRLTAPFYIEEGTPFRPEMIICLDMLTETIVQHKLIDPAEQPSTITSVLHEAFQNPMAGPPRKPGMIRLENSQEAEEIRQMFPDIEVTVAPTPELDDVLDTFSSYHTEEGSIDTYFDNPRVSKEMIGNFFHAAKQFYQAAPWRWVEDYQVIKVDVPSLEIIDAYVSIMGNANESFGFIIFPSFEGFKSFISLGEEQPDPGKKFDLGTSIIAINFERGADFPLTTRKEISQNGWEVAGPNAYPWVLSLDRDKLQRPLSEEDMKLVEVCTLGLTSFLVKHRNIFTMDEGVQACETYTYGEIEVTLAAPPPLNEIDNWEEEEDAKEIEPESIHELDHWLKEKILSCCSRRFSKKLTKAQMDFSNVEKSMELFVPWLVYHFSVDGKPLVDWYEELARNELSQRVKSWLKAQKSAWLSLWEITDFVPGKSITLIDLLTGEKRTVIEKEASRYMEKWNVILARVVDFENKSLLAGVHHRMLSPLSGDDVVQSMKKRLRRKTNVSVDRLQNEKIGRFMIARWEEAVENMDINVHTAPIMQNTDSDDLLLTFDHYKLCKTTVKKVTEKLCSLEDAEFNPGDHSIVFLRKASKSSNMKEVVVGRVSFNKNKMIAESNSPERADKLKQQLQSALGQKIRFLSRTHEDPTFMIKNETFN